MKQNITLDQLNELSEKGCKSLAHWLSTKATSVDDLKENWKWTHVHGYTIPLLSIGQMIEYLSEKYREERTEYLHSMWPEWWENFDCDPEYLCDILWEAVKEILEKD